MKTYRPLLTSSCLLIAFGCSKVDRAPSPVAPSPLESPHDGRFASSSTSSAEAPAADEPAPALESAEKPESAAPAPPPAKGASAVGKPAEAKVMVAGPNPVREFNTEAY